MAAIQTLLNPLPEPKTEDSIPPSPSVPRYLPSPSTVYRTGTRIRTPSPSPGARKKQKMSKDQAVFTRGAIHGECRYPPYEYQDELLKAHHQQFELHPIGQIADFARHIPYNSEKKLFESKTGRPWFEVFQYNYRIPGDEKVYCMMWDYNIGLVRTTPLFRCMGYSKTTPAKMLNRNPGLRDICHSITGGSLVAQGYWMPYEAARAIAATFCWKMRYALTPVFGLDFPDTCLPPDNPHYGDMMIDHVITKRCTEDAAAYRLLELEKRNVSATAGLSLPSPLTPTTPTHPRPYKELRPKNLKLDTAPPSGYTTDSSSVRGATYQLASPNTQYRNVWTPANTPCSTDPADTRLPSPRDILASATNTFAHKRKASHMSDSSSDLSSAEVSPKTVARPRGVCRVDDEYDGDSSSSGSASEWEGEMRRDGLAGLTGRDGKMVERGRMPSDEKAAYLLMGLKLQKNQEEVGAGGANAGEAEVQGRKRRATG